MSMDCIRCGEQVSTIDSRHTERGNMIRRRRKCHVCGHRFTTFEVTEETMRKLLGESVRLQVLSDAIQGKAPLNGYEKTRSLPKMIQHFGGKK